MWRSNFALAQLAPLSIIREMDKPHTKLEPIHLKGNSAWRLCELHSPTECNTTLAFFKTEAKVKTWIDENSVVWLMDGGGACMSKAPNARATSS